MRTTEAPPEFLQLLEFLKRNRGFDFTGYKSSSVLRRITKRMQSVGVDSFADYTDYLEVHPEEFGQLFNTILINVTEFFRDSQNWEYIMREVIPTIVASKPPDEPIRIWSAGCASGEEPYTAAMAFAEVLGMDQFRERVKIYATDVDEEALNQARQASYNSRECQGVPPELMEKYFEISLRRSVVQKDLRKSVIFGRHDLIQDAPVSRIDLLICRNTLMYFNTETQARILARFHFALREGGFLFLGKAEMLFSEASTFVPVDLRRRIFTKVNRGNLRDRLVLLAQAGQDDGAGRLINHVRMREAAFDGSGVTQLVIDPGGYLLMANDQARQMFGISQRDLGKLLQDLEVAHRPVDLMPLVEQAAMDKSPAILKSVEFSTAHGGQYVVDVQASKLQDGNGPPLGTLITFADVTRYKRLQDKLQQSNHELEAAYEELQSTSEELETTNEELQSTVEELETTNEELQSTNEELETMIEELQSTNEELQTINDELRLRSDELNHVNAFIGAILTSLRGGVVVLDREMQVRVWNHRSEDLWGLRSEEVIGQHFLNLDIGLPTGVLRPHIRACIAGDSGLTEILLEATNRRGKLINCKVTITPLMGPDSQIQGAILLAEEPNGNGAS
jgi:two-component system CheB/CheR fusion protein